MKCKWTWILRSMFFALVMCVLLCLGTGAVKAPDRELPPGMRRFLDGKTPEERATVERHLGVNFRMVDASLEVREQVDFLLTPALLVQEAVSDGVVLTYPEE